MAQQINLINPALIPRFDPFNGRYVAFTGLIVLAVVVAVEAWVGARAKQLQQEEAAASAQLTHLQTELASATKALASRKTNPALTAELEKTRTLVALRQGVVEALEAGAAGETKGFAEYFKGLSRQTLEGIWLTGFAVRGNELELQGRMLDPAVLPGYLVRLNGETAFAGKRFAALDLRGVEASAAANQVAVAGAPVEGKAKARHLPAYTEFVLRSTIDSVPDSGGKN